MGKAKDILLRPIAAAEANELVRRVHYSGKIVNNSQIHIGVFLHGKLEGAMQFGPSLDKRKIQGLVSGTQWHEFIELNRMAFTDVLPRNSESRAIAIAMKLLRKYAPQIKWVVTFADGTQCGDGTIYRASGFVLTGIKKNDQIWAAPTGAREARTSLTDNKSKGQQAMARRAADDSRTTVTKGAHIIHSISARRGYGVDGGFNLKSETIHSASLRPGIGAIGCAAMTGGASSMKAYVAAGFEPLEGFQLRYIYFVDPSYRQQLTVPILPFDAIEKAGARMYRGERLDILAGEATSVASGDQPEEGGATPTPPLHMPELRP